MGIHFYKMQALGNDFIVIDGVRQRFSLSKQDIIRLADRHTGIGFDQCLIVEPSTIVEVDFMYRIFNADGEAVGQCGNGARCVMRFLEKTGLTEKKSVTIATMTTRMTVTLTTEDCVKVDLGYPKFSPKDIPLLRDKEATTYQIALSDGKNYAVHAVSLGNPHAVMCVSNLRRAPLKTLGHAISTHPDFPMDTNVGFMKILSHDAISLRVYERGVGETLACGSGAAAAAVIGIRYYQLLSKVAVHMHQGILWVEWCGQSTVSLTGPAEFVYHGVFQL